MSFIWKYDAHEVYICLANTLSQDKKNTADW
jgi:hypothetical protein